MLAYNPAVDPYILTSSLPTTMFTTVVFQQPTERTWKPEGTNPKLTELPASGHLIIQPDVAHNLKHGHSIWPGVYFYSHRYMEH